MKKFLPSLLLLILLPAIALVTAGPTFAACGTISVSGSACPIPGGVSCGPSNPLTCCSPASECATAPTPPPTTIGCTEGPWYEQTPCQFYNKVKGGGTPDTEIFGERYTYAQINWIINSLSNMIMPNNINSIQDLQNLIQGLISDNGQSPSLQNYAKLGLPGLLLGGISSSLNNPPASGVQYLANLGSRMQIVPVAHAANSGGYGYNTLSVVLTLWGVTRNMAYLVMTILLVASGFLIMFRVKINPQTVVSLQTMIPKLIVTMLLVTFSFAIAGLVIDLIYVIISAVFGMLMLPPGVIHPTSLPNAISWFTSSRYDTVVAYFLFPWGMIMLAGGLIGLIPTGFTQAIAGIMVIISLVVIIFIVWNLFKIWWMLVKAQVTLILLIIVGPLQIMLDLIPGQSGFSSWFRNVIANASVFATVPIMFLLNMLFWKPFFGLSNISWAQSAMDWFSSILSPLGAINTGIGAGSPLPNLPFVNGSGAIFNFIVGYVILSLTPKVADIIRDALKVPAFKYGTAFGEALTGPYTLGIRGVSIATDIRKAWTSRLGSRVPGNIPPAPNTSPATQPPTPTP